MVYLPIKLLVYESIKLIGNRLACRLFVDAPSYQAVVDSIMDSGTGVGMEKTAVFTLDDGRKDTVIVHTLYRDQKAVGTLQVRSLGEGQYNIMIIDQEEKK